MSMIVGDVTAALSGRYRIERELGAGGMATVYAATIARSARLTHAARPAWIHGRGELAPAAFANYTIARFREAQGDFPACTCRYPPARSGSVLAERRSLLRRTR